MQLEVPIETAEYAALFVSSSVLRFLIILGNHINIYLSSAFTFENLNPVKGFDFNGCKPSPFVYSVYTMVYTPSMTLYEKCTNFHSAIQHYFSIF